MRTLFNGFIGILLWMILLPWLVGSPLFDFYVNYAIWVIR